MLMVRRAAGMVKLGAGEGIIPTEALTKIDMQGCVCAYCGL